MNDVPIFSEPGLHAERAAGTPRNRQDRYAAFAFVSVAAIVAAMPPAAHGAAWTRAEGSSLFSVPMSFGTTDEQYDSDGNKSDRPEFNTFEISPTYEYGFTDDLTFGMQPRYIYVEQETEQGDTLENDGLADAEFYLRKNLWRSGDAALSAQGLIKLPVDPKEDTVPALGRDQVDAEVSLMYGNRHRGDSATFFYNVDVGYRKRFEDPDDQAKLNAFAGLAFDRWTFMVTSNNTIGLQDPELNFDIDEVLTAGRSFTRYEAGLVASYRVTDSFSIGANVSTTYAGENVGASDYVGLSAYGVW